MRLKGEISREILKFVDEWFSDSKTIVAHTSGSTGKPKTIRLLKEDMRLSARATNRFFGITKSSRLVCPLSIDYIAGKMMIVRADEAGCELWMETPSSTPLRHDYGIIDLLPVVPPQVPSIIANGKGIRNLLVGGARVDPIVEERLKQSGINAFVGYGMTETCSHVALRRIGDSHYKAMDGISFSTDDRGCLVVEGGASGPRRLVTNDLVNLLSHTAFEWLGRIDNVINSGGIKVCSEEIERLIAPAIPAGHRFYVAPVPDSRWGQTPAIFIEIAEHATTDSNDFCNAVPSLDSSTLTQVLSAARALTTGASRPTQIHAVPHLPTTPTGKLRRFPLTLL